MSTFVLVHGAWHGGWAWQRVTPALRGAGFEVHTPTLTGLSDRSHLLSPQVGLATHIQDVVALIEAYDITDAVVVGHSYAGQVISAVVDQVPQRISQRIHLDAFIGLDQSAAIDLLPHEVAEHYRHSVEEAGFGWLIPVRPLERLGITEQTDIDWLTPRLTPHPWSTYTDRLALTGNGDGVPAAFIECVAWKRVFTAHAAKAASLGWPVYEISAGHEAMVTAPDQLAALLLEIAAQA